VVNDIPFLKIIHLSLYIIHFFVADIAFIGQEPILRVFTYFGAAVFQVATAQEAEEKLRELSAETDQACKIIYIEERLAEPIQESIKMLNMKNLPVISIVSSRGKPQGVGKTALNKLVRKATGVDMRIG
jgi:vacuolar-type H+-ATPase subunit F/Vma7